MQALAFPLRVRLGQPGKTDVLSGFESLVAVMARTPRGSWEGHPLFGFRDFFAGPSVAKDLPEPLVREINHVLCDLGLERFVVEGIYRGPHHPGGSEEFVLRFRDRAGPSQSDGDRTRTITIKL